jgi:hypothetical protein
VRQEPGGSQPAGAWPGLGNALLLALLATSARLLAAQLLGEALGFRDSVLGMSAIVGFGVALALAAPRLRVPAPLAFGMVPARRITWLAVPLCVPWLLLVSELDNYVAHALPRVGDPAAVPTLDGPLALVELVLAVAIAAPVCQELFFRGLLQTALVPRLGRWRALLLVALLDGLALFPLFGPRALVSGAAQALALGFLREAAGSLRPALALHVAFGAVAVVARLGAFGIPGFDDTSVAHTPPGWLVGAAVACACAFALCTSALRRSGAG